MGLPRDCTKRVRHRLARPHTMHRPSPKHRVPNRQTSAWTVPTQHAKPRSPLGFLSLNDRRDLKKTERLGFSPLWPVSDRAILYDRRSPIPFFISVAVIRRRRKSPSRRSTGFDARGKDLRPFGQWEWAGRKPAHRGALEPQPVMAGL